MKSSKHRTVRLSSLAEDMGMTLPEETPYRARLHHLFAQIEKEFEMLYLENLSLQEKLDNYTNKDSVQSYERSTSTNPSGGAANTTVTAVPVIGHDDGDNVVCSGTVQTTGSKSLKSKFTSSGGKVKASHKIKAQTSRIVSSFKAQSVVSTVMREFGGHKDGVWQVAAKVGQPIIGTASADHTACIWGVECGRCLLQYTGHIGSVNSIKFHQNRDLVLTGSGDGTAHIWQAAVNWEVTKKGHSSEEELDDSDGQAEDRVDTLRTPLCEFTGLGGHLSVVVAADWLPNMDQIITGSWDRTAILWDVETREPIQPLTGHDHELTHVSAHPTQRLVVTASRDSTFRLWDFRDPIPGVSVFQGHTESVTSTVFTKDDKVVSGSDDRTVKVWELRNMRSALTTIRTDSSVNRLAVSSGGIIAIPHDNRQIRLFDLNGQRVARLPRTSRQVMKALCYGSKLIAGYYGDRKPELAKRFAIASSRISGARATLRLIDDIPMIQYAIEYGWGQNESDPTMAVLGVIANIIDLLYYPVEKLCWLSEHRIIELKNADNWDNLSTVFWVLGVYLNLMRTLRNFGLNQQKIKLVKDPQNSPEDELKVKKQRLEILSLIRLTLDFVHAGSYLPKGYLWGGKLSTFQIGAVGTLSAGIGIYQIFAKRRLNK